VCGVSKDPALVAYDAFAPIYDDFTHQNDYEMWLGEVLLPELERHGLRQGRALDVACGTGRAFEPLLSRGWDLVGCDISPGMLEVARREFPDVPLHQADMRELPVYGEFELVLTLNDAVNYLLGDGDFERAFAAMGANMAADGLLLFDCNSFCMYESAYGNEERTVERDGRRWTWRGVGATGDAPDTYEARIEGDGIEPVVHRERFRSDEEIREALSAAGLDCLAAYGMDEVEGKVVLHDPIDEVRHYKRVYIAGKPRG
jgi:SAM-dependent methyltransferase